jgi:hemerythrin
MPIRWNNNLATGLDWQDSEHKEIVTRIVGLAAAMERHEAGKELDALLDFLGSYIVEHFGHEEEFMLKWNFPGYASHKVAHEEFGTRFRELKLSYDRQGASSYVVMHVQRWLSDWLMQHISHVDRELAAHAIKIATSAASAK